MFTPWRNHRAITTLAAVMTAGTLVTGALAATAHNKSTDHHARADSHRLKPLPAGLRFSVFSRPVAHATVSGPDALPPGAIYAATVGRHEIFALQRSGPEVLGAPNVGPEVCVLDREGALGGGMACSPTANAEQEGVELLSIETGASLTDALLLPNGVTSVEFTDRNGSSRTIPVADNVAVVEDPDLESLHYTLPGGVTKRTDVAEVTSGH
jgi:hypothetical protein